MRTLIRRQAVLRAAALAAALAWPAFAAGFELDARARHHGNQQRRPTELLLLKGVLVSAAGPARRKVPLRRRTPSPATT